MNYKNIFKKVLEETTTVGGGVFGTSAGIGQQGGNVGNIDFYATGDARNIWGGPPQDMLSGRYLKKGKRKNKKEKSKFPLYTRQFVELINREWVESEDRIFNCIVRVINENCIHVLIKILEKEQIEYIIHDRDVVELKNTRYKIETLIEQLSSIIGNDNMLVLIGEMDEQIPGGNASGKTIETIANHHSVSVEKIKQELEIGIKIEMEHTDNSRVACEIAMDHLWEFSNYYSEFVKFEDKLKKQNNERK